MAPEGACPEQAVILAAGGYWLNLPAFFFQTGRVPGCVSSLPGNSSLMMHMAKPDADKLVGCQGWGLMEISWRQNLCDLPVRPASGTRVWAKWLRGEAGPAAGSGPQ